LARVFIDTNILVYADDASAGEKRARAQAVIREHIQAGTAVISTQVLQEFYVIATKKLALSPEAARRRVEVYAQLDPVAAIDIHRLGGISFWDALIVRCAAIAGCERLISEDLGHGKVVSGVRIENPFKTAS